MKKIIIILLSLLALQTYAQRTISGNVKDVNGDTLIGATIIIKGTTIGTLTDIEGNYSIIITDVNLCTASASVSITEPTPLLLTTSAVDGICSQPNGAASVSDRRLDLAFRLKLAGVEHTLAASAIDAIRDLPPGPVELLATYTAFHDVLKELHVQW